MNKKGSALTSSKYRILLGICIGLTSTLPACALKRANESAPSGAASPAPVAADATAAPEQVATEQRLRQVIRKADLALDVPSPSDALRRATQIAEQRGGFVANSSSSRGTSRDAEPDSVTLTLRIPADHFSETLSELRQLSRGPGVEQIGSEDVSEECLDLDARLKTQRALEQQFLEILKRADKVEDALRVQREIATVRAEIERLDGRRRLLAREVALATINLTLSRERPLVSASFQDLGDAARHASADAVNNASGLIGWSLRALGATLPVLVILGTPAWLLMKLARRRRRARLAAFAAPSQ